MTTEEFNDACAHLCELRPTVYLMSELRFWTHDQIIEELANVATEEDHP